MMHMTRFTLDKLAANKWRNGHELQRLAVASPHSIAPNGTLQYALTMQQVTHDFHPDLKQVPMFSYGGTWPGPVIEAEQGKPLRVSWLNGLVGKSLRALIDMGVRQGMEEDHMLDMPHNGVHLHGARVLGTSDGHPDHFFHPNEGRIFHYPNNQAACTMWYHDHTMDVTRLNVYAGLHGVYLLRSSDEKAKLPHGQSEITLMLQDKSFTESSSGKRLFYEQTSEPVAGTSPQEYTVTPEFIGDLPVVNGQIWPTATLEPKVYRLRLINGANTRVFHLSVSEQTDHNAKIPLYVIGTEGGFLPKPTQAMNLLIATGERYDVLLDLRGLANATYILRNNAGIPYSPGAAIGAGDACDELMRIKVKGSATLTADDAPIPPEVLKLSLPLRDDPLPNDIDRASFDAINNAIDAVPLSTLTKAMRVQGHKFKLRRFKLEEYQLLMPTLPGIRVPTVLINAKNWMTAKTININKNDYEVWEFMNTTPDTHPMHIHLVQFQVLCRHDLDITAMPKQSEQLPEPQRIDGYKNKGRHAIHHHEQGWKDTVCCHPGQSTRVMMRFDGYIGDYVYHCHILEHEDMGMMYKIRVDL
jgi:spore coat protein A, manganese oxidase